MNHRPTLVFVFLAAILLANSTSTAQKAITVRGEIVDVQSYVKDGLKPSSPAKKEAALESLKHGSMLGILEQKTGKLYLLSSAASDSAFTAMIKPYFGLKSFVKGPCYNRSGARLILVEDVGKLTK